MTIRDIYEKYKIMPNLQLHQLRVAAVAEQVCDSLSIPVDKESIVLACLLHDMGNIIKTNFTVFPEEYYMPEGSEYWAKVQQEFIEKYGPDEALATIKILQEIGIDEVIQNIIKDSDFAHIREILNSHSIEKQIMKYSDLRVGPHGVVSLLERLEDARVRYGEWGDNKTECAFEIEKYIFSHSSLAPEDINDESIKIHLEKLRNTNIS